MLPTVRAIPSLVVTAAAVAIAAQHQALAAGDAAILGGPWADIEGAMQLARDAGIRIMRWVDASYAMRPAVMIGLAGAVLLPLLALIGFFIYRRPTIAPNTSAVRSGEMQGADSARLEIDGAGTIALPAGRDLVQIGRLADNDICIEDDSVQQYHAVIARSDEQGFTITDVSGLDADGLRINGHRKTTAVLVHGDLVELGKTRLRFATAA